VKARVAGHGHAGKQQMQLMSVPALDDETPEPSDAADALAVALCHLQAEQVRQRFGPAGSGGISEAARASRGNRFHRLAKTKFGQAAQRVAGCRASYRRV